jgi:hypothetical protein
MSVGFNVLILSRCSVNAGANVFTALSIAPLPILSFKLPSMSNLLRRFQNPEPANRTTDNFPLLQLSLTELKFPTLTALLSPLSQKQDTD